MRKANEILMEHFCLPVLEGSFFLIFNDTDKKKIFHFCRKKKKTLCNENVKAL